MARILYITNGMASTLHSSFELSRLLAEAGHTVEYASPEDVEEPVRAHGFPFHALTRDARMARRVEADPRPSLARPVPLLAWARRRRALRRDSIEDRELENLVERLSPDLLLIDIELHAAIIVTARFRLPTLLPIVWFTIFRHPGLPPMHTPLRPDAGRVAIELAWLRIRLESAWLRLRGRLWLPRWFRPVAWGTINVGDLGALARSRGYSVARRTDRSQWLRPWLYRDLPVLCFNAREMELPHAFHPNLRYVGPMVERRRREPRAAADSLAAWQRFRDRRAGETEHRPLVYCSLGSFWSADRDFLRRVLQVFERRPEWDLVLGLGGKLGPEDLAPVPPNALLLGWAPQVEVLELADCAVTHGGITTINECITCGVPMVTYSTKHVDQDGCAVRVEIHSLGIAADKDRDGSREIEANVERVLTDPSIRQRVEAMRETFRAYEQRGDAVRVIEETLRGR